MVQNHNLMLNATWCLKNTSWLKQGLKIHHARIILVKSNFDGNKNTLFTRFLQMENIVSNVFCYFRAISMYCAQYRVNKPNLNSWKWPMIMDYGAMAQCLGHWITNPGVSGSKPLSDCKVARPFIFRGQSSE